MINGVSSKLEKVNDSFTVYMYDNGYMVEVSGRDEDGNYKTAKMLFKSKEDLHEEIDNIFGMPKDE